MTCDWEDFYKEWDKVTNYYMGLVMRKTGGRADPHLVRRLIERRIITAAVNRKVEESPDL